MTSCHGVLLRASLLVLMLASSVGLAWSAETEPKRIVLIAGKKSHGPEGNGIHDYPWSVKLLKVMLDNSNIADRVEVEYHLNGWPEDPQVLRRADTIMVISDGRDGDLYEEAPHFQNERNAALIEQQIARGCGFLTFHFSTFAPDKYAQQILDWSGGYFDWEENGQRKWYSAIRVLEGDVQLASPEHPITRGIKPFKLREEFYYNIRFNPEDAAFTPILEVPALEGREPDGNVVAWARERADGGRGFGTTCGHFYEHWKQPQFRKLVLNAIAWSAHVEVPKDGVEAEYYSHEEITAALTGVSGAERAVVDKRPIRALILTGAHHPGHLWQKTTPVLVETLKRDPRIQVEVSETIEDLASSKLMDYDLLVLNYCNWQKPGISDAAKANFVKYLESGGGLVIVHFANGAFHFSLPEAGESDWPEYRKICRRVWNHHGQSSHDPYGPFKVEFVDKPHPITAGLKPYETVDELYFNQEGNAPIEVLAYAHSKVTGKDEPLSFVYEYGQGRVFQTLLGHSVTSLQASGTAKQIVRSAAWVARRPQTVLAAAPEAVQPPAAEPAQPIAGRFGQALSQPGGAFADPRNEYRRPPITVECWAKLHGRDSYNILLANETKASQSHWEIFTRPNSGTLTVYITGMRPDHVNTEVDICDDKWHYIAMIYEPRRIRLFIDGKQVADQQVEFQGGNAIAGPLAVASLVERNLGCAGIIDEVRITRGVRPIKGVPDKPFTADNKTLGLWHFDKLEAGDRYADSSSLKNPMLLAQATAAASNEKDHFGEEVLGFRWSEKNSVDNRWNEMEIGRFLASTIPVMDQSPVAKGLSIRLGDQQEATVCYDTERLALRTAWTGKFLNFTPARFGLISSPQMAGELAFASKQVSGWQQSARFTGHYRHGDRIVLAYQVGDCQVLETPWIESHAEQLAFTRTFEFSPTTEALSMHVGQYAGEGRMANINGVELALVEQAGRTIACALAGRTGAKLSAAASGDVTLSIPANKAKQSVKLLLWSGPTSDLPQFAALVQSSSAPAALAPLTQPGPPQWTEKIVTQGVLGNNPGPYAIDTVTLPFKNPYRALMFVGGHDFFSNGDMAVCTVHGDVWRVSGVDASLKQLTWKRYATGLFQPLGLRIINDQVYVLGRDQITRLHDKNNDGEADFYENFSNLYETSPGGHDYVACLEIDPAGNFYLIHALQGVVRISPDGKQLDIVGTGLRNPNGLSVGPSGMITAAPQEGNWTPASCIVHVEEGGYYGFGGPKPPTAERPLGYDLPLCWIPRLQDNSSGGQAWVTSDRWGLPRGSLLHLSYGKCRMMLVLHERIGKQSQGGVIDFPLDFESGVMRGSFSPHDGQLYLSGLKGWTTAAVQDGCLQRVRYRGQPVDMPLEIRSLKNGLAITFTRELNREAAEDTGNYHLQQWNYKYASSYGSAEYRVSDPRQQGRDEVNVTSATLLDDRRTVFLEIPDMQPVNQMTIGYTLTAADGASLRQSISYTIHALQDEQMDPAKLARHESAGELTAEEAAALQPGLIQQFTQAGQSDARNARLAALHVPVGTPPTPFLEAGRFSMTSTGYIRVPLKGEYTFQLQGEGTAALLINGRDILKGAGDLAKIQSVTIPLHRGYNRLELRYTTPADGDATVRLYWSSDTFASEPVPAHVLACDSRNETYVHSAQLRQGRELVATHKCFQCHAPPANVAREEFRMPELHDEAPQLTDAGNRFQHDWLAHWLLAPQSLRNEATMPQLFDAEKLEDRQKVADLAAYLTSLAGQSPTSSPTDLDDEKLVAAGEVLYEDLSCISCHRLTEPAEEDEFERLSLAFVGAKYQPAALVDFLQRPHAHHADSRMPDFQLSEAEANALAAFLRSQGEETVIELNLPQGSTQRGQELFRTSGCVNCHSTGLKSADVALTASSIQGRAASAGCLHREKETPVATPKYEFTEEELAALAKFLETDGESLTRVVAPEASQRLVRTLNCQACHSRDNEQSPRAMIITEEGSRGLPPEMLPNLTFTGEKLQVEWMEKLLRGKLDYQPRPWLTARMPAFPAHAQVLAAGLAAEHGHSPTPSTPLSIDPQRVEVGHRLAMKEGLDCRQCHAIGRDLPQGDENTQIAPGINFAHIRERLRPDFYHRFVLDPPRYDINTKMPKLAADGVTTKVHAIYDGDASRQFEALWHYIQTIEPNTTTESPPDAAP